MSRVSRTAAALMLVLAGAASAGEWTAPVDILYDFKKCVSYRARLNGEYLVIEAAHQTPWHTVAMDNTRRAQEKLQGKTSLGVDTPTEFKLSKGLEVVGPWYQTPPKDISKPELLWFTWGFEGQAVFVAKVKRSGAGPANIDATGQVCTDTLCKKFEVEIPLPLAGADTGVTPIDFKSLVQVR